MRHPRGKQKGDAMQRGTASHRDELPQALANHLSDTDEPVLLTGPHGSGKTHTLRALSALLTSTGTPHLVARGASNDSAPRLAQLPAGTLVLFDDYELASYETLQAIARHITDGGKVVATVTEAHVDTGYGERMRRLYELFPEAQQTLERTRSIRLAPFTDSEIANIVHRASPEPLTSVTVAAIQQLSWGLPGAALTLLQLHRSGSLSSTPRPRITRTHTVDMHLAALHQPVRVAEAQLSSEQVAAAVVLSEIGPRSRSGIADVFGATTQANLFDSGFLLPHPGSVEVFGVPELYAAAVRNLTSAEVLNGIRQSTAMHLLSQETLGIPMPDREAIFCARVLSRHDSSLTADPLLDEHHARFLQRIIDDLLCFGEGERARDLLLRLGNRGPALCPVRRARLTTMLRDAHTGLQTLLVSRTPQGNCELPPVDPEERISQLALRARLSAEAGLPFEADPDLDEGWDDALLVIRRWNDSQPLASDAPELLRIARSHPRPEIALLAEQLLTSEAAINGVSYRSLGQDNVEQRIGRIAMQSSELLRDLLVTSLVAGALVRFFAPGKRDDDGRIHDLVDHLPGASRHRIWLTHLTAARTALLCSDLARAASEWEGFATHAPRFIAYRLQTLIAQTTATLSEELATQAPNRSYSAQLFRYFSGSFDALRPETFAELSPLSGRTRPSAAIDRSEAAQIEELPYRRIIRAHLEALRTQNPAALMRAAEALDTGGMPGPAAHALREARRIFLRRRASGSVAAADARLAALAAAIEQQVPWYDAGTVEDAPRERLTPREAVTAQLAAEGLSNRQIAERMRCSVRTVESHLAQARAKLGVANRDAMRAKLHGIDGGVGGAGSAGGGSGAGGAGGAVGAELRAVQRGPKRPPKPQQSPYMRSA